MIFIRVKVGVLGNLLLEQRIVFIINYLDSVFFYHLLDLLLNRVLVDYGFNQSVSEFTSHFLMQFLNNLLLDLFHDLKMRPFGHFGGYFHLLLFLFAFLFLNLVFGYVLIENLVVKLQRVFLG